MNNARNQYRHELEFKKKKKKKHTQLETKMDTSFKPQVRIEEEKIR